MKKKRLKLLLLIAPLLLCVAPVLFCHVWLFTDFGCFGTLFPSASRLTEITNVNFPTSTTNLEWRCRSGLDANEIHFRFWIAPSDIQNMVGASEAYAWQFSNAHYLLDLFNDQLADEQHAMAYSTWQTNSTCGYTNFLIAMDEPDTYVVYADYRSWEDCWF